MKTDLAWLNMELEFDLIQLESYLEEITKALKHSADEYEKTVTAKAEKMSRKERAQYFEWHSDTFWEFTEVFPRMLNNSLLLTIYSFFEATINNIAFQFEKTKPDGVKRKDIRGDGIEQCRTYLKKVHSINFPDDTAEWHTITLYRKIRNLIAHNDAKLRPNNDKDVKPYIERNPTYFKIDQFNQIETLEEGNANLISTIRDFTRLLLEEVKGASI